MAVRFVRIVPSTTTNETWTPWGPYSRAMDCPERNAGLKRCQFSAAECEIESGLSARRMLSWGTKRRVTALTCVVSTHLSHGAQTRFARCESAKRVRTARGRRRARDNERATGSVVSSKRTVA